MRLWFVNQYATKAPGVGETRHHLLARSLRAHAIETTILAAEAAEHERLRGSRRARRATRIEATPDVTFAWLPSRAYTGNGLGRVVNMALYAGTLLRRGMRPARMGVEVPDVVVASNPQPFASLAGWALARRHRARFVFEVRDLWPESLVGILGVSRRHPLVLLFGAIEKFLYRHSDALIGVLPGVGEHARERVGRRAPRFTWIPNGVALADVGEPARLREPDGEFRMVYAGTHGPPNCLHTLLEAARMLMEKAQDGDPEFRFDLYGDGISKPALQRYATEHQLRSVHFHDPVPKDEVPGLLAGGDALLLLFRRLELYRFGVSPNKLFDYLAAGRPIVLALSAEYDPVGLAGAGVTAPAEDPAGYAAAIRAVARAPIELRRAMAANGRRFAQQHHDMSVLGATYARTLRSVVAGRGIAST